MSISKQKKWMVLYTRSRWEKKVSKSLVDNNFTSYCPLVKTKSQWADRQKVLELPLFNSYIFVHAVDSDLNSILQTSGILSYIKYGGKPAVVNDDEINDIKEIVKNYSDIETLSISGLNVGDKALIQSGPLSHLCGEVRHIQGKKVVMVIKELDCIVTVNVDNQNLITQNNTLPH